MFCAVGGGCHGVQRMGEAGSVGVQSGAHILRTGSSFLEAWRVTAGLYWDYRVGTCVCVCVHTSGSGGWNHDLFGGSALPVISPEFGGDSFNITEPQFHQLQFGGVDGVRVFCEPMTFLQVSAFQTRL